jgi:site-specific DNA recombinase
VSDEDKQTPERSFSMQRHSIHEQLLTPSDLNFKREYTDMLTGTSPNRKDYQQMLSDAEAGRFTHLGLYRADRFGRNAVEGLQAATKLISQGIKVRVANMPSLMPETPDGFFMFLLQMGLAQREVDVLRERTRDGMGAKLRAGGWPQRAPDGYVNKERQVSSNKYERWVEIDPEFSPVLKYAWELLLTGRATLKEICEALAQRGWTRASGRPWAWNDPKSGTRQFATNRLHNIFHNPFYAGWSVSERFGIKMGEVRGKWQPLISTDQFHRGVEILHKNDKNKSRIRKRNYLLRGILWVRTEGKQYKLYGSTPTGRSHSYAYYITHAKPNGRALHIACEVVDNQVPGWLGGIAIDPELIPTIRDIYKAEIRQVSSGDRDSQRDSLTRQLAQLKEEEARLGRLLITGKMSEATYDRLRAEWQDKLRNIEIALADLERDTTIHLDDLDVALALLAKIEYIYPRLEEKQQATLLQVLAKQIMITPEGEIIGQELHSPFVYLRSIADDFDSSNPLERGSEQVRLGALIRSHLMPGGFIILETVTPKIVYNYSANLIEKE